MTQLECIYPVKPFSDWTIHFWIRADMKPKTVTEIAIEFNLKPYQVRRMMEPFVNQGWLYKRQETFWNGMFYARRFYYW